jgi:hypothetical protein
LYNNTCLPLQGPAPWWPAPCPGPRCAIKATGRPTSSRLLLKQSTGLPLSASLLALLQQHGGDASCFDEWLAHAAEWDSYVKRDKEAGSLLLHLLRTGEDQALAMRL